MPPPRKTTWAWTAATVCGVGYLRPGSGTYGSITAVLLWYGAAHLFHPEPPTLAFATAFAALLVLFVGVPASTLVARESQRKDPGFIVIDEVAGQLIALIFLFPDAAHALLALLLFRLFDILKPWPIRRLEALPEGPGIMLDDAAAGLAALLSAFLLIRLDHLAHRLVS